VAHKHGVRSPIALYVKDACRRVRGHSKKRHASNDVEM